MKKVKRETILDLSSYLDSIKQKIQSGEVIDSIIVTTVTSGFDCTTITVTPATQNAST